MVENPTDAVPQILIKIQDSIAALRSEVGTIRSEVGQFRTSVEGRLDRLEQLNRKYSARCGRHDGDHASDSRRFRRARQRG
jgi:hypothetical protein